ncbi:hypothetical protein ACFL5K_03510 [Gemmatimonadota bacterium]
MPVIALLSSYIPALAQSGNQRQLHFYHIRNNNLIIELQEQVEEFGERNIENQIFWTNDKSAYFPRSFLIPPYEIAPGVMSTPIPITIPFVLYDQLQNNFVVDFHPVDTAWTEPNIPDSLYRSDVFSVIPKEDYLRVYRVDNLTRHFDGVAHYDSILGTHRLRTLNQLKENMERARDAWRQNTNSAQITVLSRQYDDTMRQYRNYFRNIHSKYNSGCPYITFRTGFNTIPGLFLDPRVFVNNSHYYLNHMLDETEYEPAMFPEWIWQNEFSNVLTPIRNKNPAPIKLFDLFIPVKNTIPETTSSTGRRIIIELHERIPGKFDEYKAEVTATLFPPKVAPAGDQRKRDLDRLKDWWKLFNYELDKGDFVDDYEYPLEFRRKQRSPGDSKWWEWLLHKNVESLLWRHKILANTKYGLYDPATPWIPWKHYRIPEFDFFPREYRVFGGTQPTSEQGVRVFVADTEARWTNGDYKNHEDMRRLFKLKEQFDRLEFKVFKQNADEIQVLVLSGYWDRNKQRLYAADKRENALLPFMHFYQFDNLPSEGYYQVISEGRKINDTINPYRDRYEKATIIVKMLDFNRRDEELRRKDQNTF